MEEDPDAQDPFEEAIEQSLEEAHSHKPSHPNELFILPLNRRPFFPGMAAPIVIEPGPYYEVLKMIAKSDQKLIALLLTKKENANIYRIPFSGLHKVGVLGRILRIIPIEGGGAQVVFNMEERVEILEPIKNKYLKAKVTYHPDNRFVSDELKAYAINIITVIKELLKLNPLFKEELQVFLGHSDFTEPGKLADFAVALTTATRDELQDVLEAFDVQMRIDKALFLLKKELDLSRLQSSINQKIEATISKSQKEYFLREQLKTIKKELGIEKEEKSIDTEKFEGRLKKREVPPHVMETIQEELDKLNALEPISAEYSVARNYLDWLTIVPWGIFSKEKHDLEAAEKILQKDHYGLYEFIYEKWCNAL